MKKILEGKIRHMDNEFVLLKEVGSPLVVRIKLTMEFMRGKKSHLANKDLQVFAVDADAEHEFLAASDQVLVKQVEGGEAIQVSISQLNLVNESGKMQQGLDFDEIKLRHPDYAAAELSVAV